jgi:hypothetical protein
MRRRDLKEDALQTKSRLAIVRVWEFLFLRGTGFVKKKKVSISPKIESRQTTNQFIFVLYASLKKKIM